MKILLADENSLLSKDACPAFRRIGDSARCVFAPGAVARVILRPESGGASYG